MCGVWPRGVSYESKDSPLTQTLPVHHQHALQAVEGGRLAAHSLDVYRDSLHRHLEAGDIQPVGIVAGPLLCAPPDLLVCILKLALPCVPLPNADSCWWLRVVRGEAQLAMAQQ